MANSSASISTGGLLVPGLTLLFTYFKLTGKIDWSWWWVLSPVWIGLIITVFFMIGFAALLWWAKKD